MFLHDALAHAARGHSSAQCEVDYGILKGLKLNDEYSRAFQIACALGYDGSPFAAHPDRRAVLCAALNARYARLSGRSRDELCYILDPADAMGEDYPLRNLPCAQGQRNVRVRRVPYA